MPRTAKLKTRRLAIIGYASTSVQNAPQLERLAMSGWFVEVETKRLGSDQVGLSELYAVWDGDRDHAVTIVKLQAKVLDEKVTALFEASDAVLQGCKVPKGEARLVSAVSSA